MAKGLRIQVEPTRVELKPGGDAAVLTAHVYNATRIVDEFEISVIGTGKWLRAETQKLRLFPDTDGTAEVEIDIPKDWMVTAGERTVGVQARSISDPSVSGIERVQVSVAEVVAGEALSLEPQVLHGGSSAQMIVKVRNGGNTPLQLTMLGEDPEREVAFRFEPVAITVPPGGQGWSRVSVSAKAPFRGGDRNRQLVVKAEGGHVPLVQSATFVQRPFITPFRLYLIRALLTLAGAFLMVAGAFASWVGKTAGTKLTIVAFLKTAFELDVKPPDLGDVGTFLVSTGFVVIILAVVAALGIFGRRARLTKLGAGLALFLLIGFVVVILPKVSLGVGVWASLFGSLVAVVAGLLGTSKYKFIRK